MTLTRYCWRNGPIKVMWLKKQTEHTIANIRTGYITRGQYIGKSKHRCIDESKHHSIFQSILHWSIAQINWSTFQITFQIDISNYLINTSTIRHINKLIDTSSCIAPHSYLHSYSYPHFILIFLYLYFPALSAAWLQSFRHGYIHTCIRTCRPFLKRQSICRVRGQHTRDPPHIRLTYEPRP